LTPSRRELGLYVVDTEGGVPRRPDRPSEDGTGTWSRDGRFIYFHSDRGGRLELWKLPAEGGAAVQVTHGGGYYGVESPDGRYVYYSNGNENAGIWRLPTSGGEETKIVEGPVAWESWALGARGIYYVDGQVGAGKSWFAIQYLDLDSRRVSEVFRRRARVLHSLTVSPDEMWILYAESPWSSSELMLVENFR
jgi:Tol biopolymer transport system component